MKNQVLILLVLSSLFHVHAMELWRSQSPMTESANSQSDELPPIALVPFLHSDSQEERTPWTLNVQNHRNILINAIYHDNEMGVTLALFDYKEVNVRGTKYGRDDPPLCVAAGQGRRRIVEGLLANGAQTHITDAHGDTALHYAVRFGHLSTAKVLHDNGALLEARNIWGQTVLHQALEVTPLNYELIQWLLEQGADVNAQDDEGMSVAHYAYMHDRDDVLDLLDTNPLIQWDLLNEDELKPSDMLLLDYYVPAPPPPPSPELPQRTISYSDIDELLGYFYTDTIETTYTYLPNNKKIITHYYLLRLAQVYSPEYSSGNEDTDDSSADQDNRKFMDAQSELPPPLLNQTITDDEWDNSSDAAVEFTDAQADADSQCHNDRQQQLDQAEESRKGSLFFTNLFKSDDNEEDSSEFEWDDE